MSDQNGSPVTRAELAAHIKGIDQQFNDISADIVEIKFGIHGITDAMLKAAAAANASSWFGLRGRRFIDALMIALIAAAVSGGLALLLH